MADEEIRIVRRVPGATGVSPVWSGVDTLFPNVLGPSFHSLAGCVPLDGLPMSRLIAASHWRHASGTCARMTEEACRLSQEKRLGGTGVSPVGWGKSIATQSFGLM